MTKAWFEYNDKILDSRHLAIPLIDLAINRQISHHALLKGTKIFYQDLTLGNLTISCQQMFKLVTNLQKLVPNNDFSFLLGRRLFPGNLGSVSQLLINCKSFASMINVLRCYQMQLFPFLHFQVEKHRQKTYFLISPSISTTEHTTFLYELLCTAINSSCKWRVNRQLPFHFYFPFERPANIFHYEENLGHRLKFKQNQMMFAIDNHWLDTPLDDSSRLIRSQNQLKCREIRQQLYIKAGLIQYIACIIRDGDHKTLDETAMYMKLSPATLKRKLKKHGTSFQKLQDKVRSQQAIFHLTVKGDANEKIARRLNFNDLTNFRRAFKRWTGMTPSELKALY